MPTSARGSSRLKPTPTLTAAPPQQRRQRSQCDGEGLLETRPGAAGSQLQRLVSGRNIGREGAPTIKGAFMLTGATPTFSDHQQEELTLQAFVRGLQPE